MTDPEDGRRFTTRQSISNIKTEKEVLKGAGGV